MLGGTGDVGARTVRELADDPKVVQISIAGRDLAKAEKLAAEIGAKAVPVAVDAADQRALVAAIRGHDVVAGALGPFYRFEVSVARAAIEAGVNYVSICDDHDATQEVLQLHELARDKGVTILTGAGWTPGLTNLLALLGVRELDSAQEIHINWVGALADAAGLAAVVHFLHVFSGQVPTFQDGRWQMINAGSGPMTVTFPEPVGDVTVYHMGHPEPITIPRFIPNLRHVTLRGGLMERPLIKLVLGLNAIGLTKTPSRRERLLRMLRPLIPTMQRIFAPPQPISGAYVVVRGEKAGVPAEVRFSIVERMAPLTAIPLAVVTLMVGSGQVSHPGVIPPEAPAGPDPELFLREIEARGLKVQRQLVTL